jgi:hypothetical protein
MTTDPEKTIRLEILLYGLPRGTDVEKLTVLARDVAESLEQMGAYGQRELEPAHLFALREEESRG